MERAAQRAARQLRRMLLQGVAEPTAIRATLSSIPPEDRDAWLDALWDVDDLPEDDPLLPRGCVPYLPCPAATVLEALEVAGVTEDDVFVDVGAGLGRVAALSHLITAAGCIGLEIQPRLVQAARARAAWLGLRRLRFLEGDAADLIRFMTIGTVFFLYCPFGGARLDRVLDELELIARTRPIRICCVGMPALERAWLSTLSPTSPDLAVYRSDVTTAA